jgi:tetratricopeptide (TPR) repeat protein
MVREEMAAIRVGSVPTFDPREVPSAELTPPSEDFISYTVERYTRNAEAMLEKARGGGVPILFVLPIANLLYPPSLSAHDPAFDRGDEFRAIKRAARRALLRGRLAEGLRHLDRASDLSPRHAMTHYRRAEVLSRLGRREEARAEYQRATDLDVRTHRITSSHEAALIETLERAGAEWIDLRPAFHAVLTPVASRPLFHDHLHPTDLGHAMIGDQIVRAIARILDLPPAS